MNSLDEIAGHAALTQYRTHGSGLDLFRAYIGRRNADKQRNEERRLELEARLPGPGLGIPIPEFEDITTDLLRLRILNELDPVIEDILYAIENPVSADGMLADFRKALRIDDGRALNDIETKRRKQLVISLWWRAYEAMPRTGWRSQRAVADSVATESGVSTRTAINHWNAFLKDGYLGHVHKKWLAEIEWASKHKRIAVVKSRPKKTTIKQRISFGKGRAIR